MFYHCEHHTPCPAHLFTDTFVALRFMKKARENKASLDVIHLIAITKQVLPSGNVFPKLVSYQQQTTGLFLQGET